MPRRPPTGRRARDRARRAPLGQRAQPRRGRDLQPEDLGRDPGRSPASTSPPWRDAVAPGARRRVRRGRASSSRASSRDSARCSPPSASTTGRPGCASRSCTRAAPYLTDDFVDENFSFYGTELTGVPVNRERWKRGVAVTEARAGRGHRQGVRRAALPADGEGRDGRTRREPHRGLPPEHHGPRVDDRRDARARAREARRVHAEDRLPGGVARLLQPRDRRRPTSSATCAARTIFEHDRQLDKVGKPIDRDEWHMPPQMVNAYYNPLDERDRVPRGDPAVPVLRRRA